MQTIRQEPHPPEVAKFRDEAEAPEAVAGVAGTGGADMTIADSDPDMTLEFDSRSSTRRGGLSTDANQLYGDDGWLWTAASDGISHQSDIRAVR